MEPITLRLPSELLEDLSQEADEQGYSSRSEYIRQIVRNRNDTGPNTDIRERVDELEQRVEQLEESPPTSQSDERDALSDSTGETMETPHRTDETAGSASEPIPDSPTVDDDEFEGAYQQWLEANGPRKPGVQEIVLDAFRFLREAGSAETSELREHLHSQHPDAYGSPKSLWDSVGSRYVADAPGIEDGGYARWEYAGDEAVREELDQTES